MSNTFDACPWPLHPEDLWPMPPLRGAGRTAVAIVGGGLAGLSAAYHLLRKHPDLDVTLLEARTIGSGASGRSTGMVGPGVGGTIVALQRRFGAAGASRMFQTTLDAVELLIRLIRDENLDCDLETGAQLQVAMTARHARALQKQAQAFDALGFHVPYCGAAQVTAAINTQAYCGALRYPRAATLNPARLCHELKRLLLEGGARLHEGTPVRAITPGRPVQLLLEEGSLRADRVIVATDGYTARLGWLAGRVVPLQTHAIMSEPLSPAQLGALGWRGREAIIDCRNYFNYYRLTPDNRLVFGGGPALYRADPHDRRAGACSVANPLAWQRLEGELTALFPALSGLSIVRRWAGTLGFTLDNLPVVGELSRGVFYSGGWCGHGLALATASGAVIAETVLDTAHGTKPLPWWRGTAPWLPPDPWRAAGLSTYLALLEMVDRLGLRLDRRKDPHQALIDNTLIQHRRIDNG